MTTIDVSTVTRELGAIEAQIREVRTTHLMTGLPKHDDFRNRLQRAADDLAEVRQRLVQGDNV